MAGEASSEVPVALEADPETPVAQPDGSLPGQRITAVERLRQRRANRRKSAPAMIFSPSFIVSVLVIAFVVAAYFSLRAEVDKPIHKNGLKARYPRAQQPVTESEKDDAADYAIRQLETYLATNGLSWVKRPQKAGILVRNMFEYEGETVSQCLAVAGRFMETADTERGFFMVIYLYGEEYCLWGDNAFLCDWTEQDLQNPLKLWLVESAKRIIAKEPQAPKNLVFEDNSKWGVQFDNANPRVTYYVMGIVSTYDAAGLKVNTPRTLRLCFNPTECNWEVREPDPEVPLEDGPDIEPDNSLMIGIVD